VRGGGDGGVEVIGSAVRYDERFDEAPAVLSQGSLLRCSQSVGLDCCPSQVRSQDPLAQRSVMESQKWPRAGS
jgi:hypothetical protein